MRLTKSTSHAIRILIDCATRERRLIKVAVALRSASRSRQQNIFKIVNLLTKAGLIEAVRGRNGGVRLARPPQLDPHRRRRARQRGDARGNRGRSARGPRSGHGVNQILDNALEAFIDVLDQHTIADMVKTQGPRRCSHGASPKPARAASFATGRGRRGLHGGG